MKTTANKQLPLYEGSDAPDLIKGYNAAMEILDAEGSGGGGGIKTIRIDCSDIPVQQNDFPFVVINNEPSAEIYNNIIKVVAWQGDYFAWDLTPEQLSSSNPIAYGSSNRSYTPHSINSVVICYIGDQVPEVTMVSTRPNYS